MKKALAFCLLTAPLLAQAQDRVDLTVVDRIKSEAFAGSKVMEILYNLTDVHGPRLTGSPGFEDAARWAMDRLRSDGMQNVHSERWGPFGRSWAVEAASVEMIAPRYAQFNAMPLAWSAPTNGPITADLILAPFKTSFIDGPKKFTQEFETYRTQWTGKLRGKIVMLSDVHVPKPQTNSQFRRLTTQDLSDLAEAPAPSARPTAKSLEELEWPDSPEGIGKLFNSLPDSLLDQLFDFYDDAIARRGDFLAKEGTAGVLLLDDRAHEGMVFAEAAGAFDSNHVMAPPTFVITAEQYDRLARLVKGGNQATVRLHLTATTSDRDVDGMNLIAEIPGGSKKDEIVMIGAHFDSWHSGTGATDNGAGSAVMMEVMRILKALNLKLERTVRLALWSGEEQGLLGSRAYVKQHFGNPKTTRLLPEYSKLSGYFNLDNGSGKIRGVYLQGHEAMRPFFEAWLAPFHDLGATTISIRNTGGTDHLSFNVVGLPGFQFIQDPLDYGSITHHSSMDTYDHAIPEDLMQASAVIATAVYQAANERNLLPRRPLPKP